MSLRNREAWYVVVDGHQENAWVIASNVPNVTMFTGIALAMREFSPRTYRFAVENNPYLINVGASPLQKTLNSSPFQICVIVEIVTPPPWKNPFLTSGVDAVWIRVFTGSNGNVVIHPAIPAMAPARRRAGQGTVCRSDSTT